jgi:transposase
VGPVFRTLTAFAREGAKGVVFVPKTRPPYPDEFRREALELLRAGRLPRELAEALGVSEQTLRNWRRQDQQRQAVLDGAKHRLAQRRFRTVRLRRSRSSSPASVSVETSASGGARIACSVIAHAGS